MPVLCTALQQASIYGVQYKHKAGFFASMDTISLSCLMASSWTAIRRRHGLIHYNDVLECDIRNVHMGSAVLKTTMVVPFFYNNLQQSCAHAIMQCNEVVCKQSCNAMKLCASNHAMQLHSHNAAGGLRAGHRNLQAPSNATVCSPFLLLDIQGGEGQRAENLGPDLQKRTGVPLVVLGHSGQHTLSCCCTSCSCNQLPSGLMTQ